MQDLLGSNPEPWIEEPVPGFGLSGLWLRLFLHRADAVAIDKCHYIQPKYPSCWGSPKIMYMGAASDAYSIRAPQELPHQLSSTTIGISVEVCLRKVHSPQLTNINEVFTNKQPTHEGLKPVENPKLGPTRLVEAQAAFPQYLERLTPLPK